MAGGGSPGVVDGEAPENRLVAIASYIAAGKRVVLPSIIS